MYLFPAINVFLFLFAAYIFQSSAKGRLDEFNKLVYNIRNFGVLPYSNEVVDAVVQKKSYAIHTIVIEGQGLTSPTSPLTWEYNNALVHFAGWLIKMNSSITRFNQ